MRILIIILVSTFPSLSFSKENTPSCPNSASGYASLVEMNKPGVEGFMERDTCFYELLNLARESNNANLTVDIIKLEIHLGASRSQSYSEFLEKLAINKPKQLLDALLNVDSHKALQIFHMLDDPLISKRHEIEESFSKYKVLDKYKALLLNF